MTIYVGNLSPETSLSVLRSCFEVFGKVTDVAISTYKVEGKFKGSGLVEMPTNDRGQAAIAGLQGKVLGGNLLTVRED